MSGNERIWRRSSPYEPSSAPKDSVTNISPENPAAKSREEFAARLRELRAQAGAPSFRQLAKLTNYSSSTLADATSGRRLPTEPVLKALVIACGADPAPWLDELRRVTPSAAQSAPDPEPSGGARADRRGRRGRRGRRRAAVLAAAGGLAVFGTGVAAGWALAPASASSGSQEAGPGMPAFSGTPTPAPTSGVSDGTDPAAGHCEADGHLVDRAPVMRGSVQIGALDLLYSPRCGAGWAMIYLYPGEPTMMGEVTVRAGDDRYTTIANPLVKQIDDYTDVIVPGPGGCLGAYGQVYQQGMPLVTASLPCEAPAR
jgi:transcriptional regulator with XRE-family HTH domain